MRGLGIFLLAAGAALAIYAFSMTTSVSTQMGEVNNLGLLNARQNYVIVSGFLFLAGVIMTTLGGAGSSADDPFERATKERKSYAVSIGIKKSDDLYVFENESFSDLEQAIAYAETSTVEADKEKYKKLKMVELTVLFVFIFGILAAFGYALIFIH